MRLSSVLVLVAFASLSLVGCTAPRPAEPPPMRPEWPKRPVPSEPIVVDEKTVILDEKEAEIWASELEAVDAWMPTTADVLVPQKALPGFLGARGDREKRIASQLDGYGQQWTGLVIHAKRYLCGNFFALSWYQNGLEHSKRDWQRRMVCVCDGGIQFFHVLYDPETREFVTIRINGEA